jgi:HEAT repeat protein
MRKSACHLNVILFGIATIMSVAVNADSETQLKNDIRSLVKRLDDESPRERGSAAKALGGAGAEAAPAVSKLIELLGDEENVIVGIPGCVCDDARDALSRIGEPALGPLIKATESSNPSVRANAAMAIGFMQPSPKNSLPALLRLLHDPSKHVRCRVLEAIVHLEPKALTAESSIMGILAHDTEPCVRSLAAWALAALDKDGTKAIPALIQSLHDRDPDVRAATADAISRFGPTARTAVMPLVESISDNELYWIHETIDMARQRPVRYAIVESLGMIGPAAAPALPKLKAALLSERIEEVRAATAIAVLRIDPQQREVLPILIKILETGKDGDSDAQTVALEGIRSLGPKAALATIALKNALQHAERNDLRAAAATALAAVSPQEDVVPFLVKQMWEEKRKGDKKRISDSQYDDDVFVRERIIQTIGTFGPSAAAATPALASVVADANDIFGVRLSAATSLGKIGFAAHEAVPQLTNALSDASERLRRLAAIALGEIGPSAKTAIPKLLELSKNDTSKATRVAAQAAIERITGNSSTGAGRVAN